MAALREVDLSRGGCSFLELTVTKRCQGRRVKTDHIVLRDWLYKHRYNAYPTRAETLVLANKTQLTKKQVSIWFINARRRILPEIIRREGRDPQKFVRGRSCSSLFSSTSVSAPKSLHQTPHPDQPLDLSFKQTGPTAWSSRQNGGQG